MSLLAAALGTLAVSLLAFVGHRLLAAAAGRAASPLAYLRALSLVGLPSTGLVTWAALALAGLGDAARALVGGVVPALADPPLGGLVAGLGYAVLVPVPILSAYLGIFPAVRRARELELSRWTAGARFYRYAAVLLAVVAVVVRGIDWALDAIGVTLVALVGAPLALGTLLWGAPFLIRATSPVRAPDGGERARIDRLAGCAGLDPARVLVREDAGTENAGAWLRGLPRRRTLLVTDYFLATLDDDTAAALLASAAARARLLHLEYRAAALLVLLAVALAALEGSAPLWVPLAYLLALPAVHLAGYRLVYRADDRTADRVGAGALADAYERFADLHDHGGGNRLYGLLVMRPPLERRIRRLRGRAG